MSEPTTLQKRQQEMHRPFQPLDTTEGRAGRAIAAPQAQYAGWADVFARTTANVQPLVNQVINARNKEDPELLLAQEYYAKGTFDLEEMIRNSTPEERDAWKKEAAAKDQTTSEYLKGRADRAIQEQLFAQGIPYRKQFAARESTLDKINLEGYKAIENRDNTFNNNLTDAAIKNGTAIYNADGSVNVTKTVQYNKQLIDATRRVTRGGDNPLAELGLTIENYEQAPPEERKEIDNQIFTNQTTAYNMMMTSTLQKGIGLLLNGELPPEKMRMEFDVLYNDAERLIQEGNYPNEAIRTRLLNHLKTYKTQIDSVLNETKITREDQANLLKTIEAQIQISALLANNKLGELARTTVAVGGQTASAIIQAEMIQDLGSQLASDIATWDPPVRQMVANRFANSYAIMNGYTPTYGSHEDQRAAKVAIDNFTKKELEANKEWEKIPFENKNVIRNNLIDTSMAAGRALQGDKGSMPYALEYYANYIDALRNPNILNTLKINKDISSQMYNVNTTAQVAARVMQSSSGPAGVWRTTGNHETRKIYYDAESDTFSSNNAKSLLMNQGTDSVGIFYPGTLDSNWEESISTLNKLYEALENATELELGRRINANEKKEVRDYIINMMYASGIPESTLVLDEEPNTVTQTNPSSYKGNTDSVLVNK